MIVVPAPVDAAHEGAVARVGAEVHSQLGGVLGVRRGTDRAGNCTTEREKKIHVTEINAFVKTRWNPMSKSHES